LQKLVALRDAGILTDDEFLAQGSFVTLPIWVFWRRWALSRADCAVWV